MSVRDRPLYAARDAKYFQRLEQERISLSGPEVNYYSLNRGRNVDPLYNEPVGWSYQRFCIVTGAIEYVEAESRDVSVRDEGEVIEQTGIVRIAYNEWKLRATVDTNGRQRWPKAGDVIEMQLEVWDVVKGNSQGNVVNQPNFVAFQLELRKRNKFIAQRKVLPVTNHVDPPGL